MMLIQHSFGVAMVKPTFSKVTINLTRMIMVLIVYFPLCPGDQYWRFDSKSDPPVSARYPKPIKNWIGLPNNLDAAFKWENGLTYFFKGTQYYRFNDGDFEVS